ncbi:carcinoembryonic antigen-related cell adhesion molecule 4-like [Dromiciops gliroides]|uniref:carcinoembryonic antigen-related cell adhesion molecule 4-like n=1 Tax=Dromiciops gliroides TaxID=33562 RepID=UPI001CC413EB|nr:carcinoembryonic antigen-related cell adhesion molecule 4-like [Dromiciops gliroides]
MAFLPSRQHLSHGSWKVVVFTASVLSSWNGTVWAEVTITPIPERATVGSSITLSVQTVQRNVLSFTWFRHDRDSSNQFCVIRPGEQFGSCGNQSTNQVVTYLNGSLTLTNLSSQDSGLYLVSINTLEKKTFWGEKYIQVHDSQPCQGIPKSKEDNLTFLVATAVLASLMIAGALSCVLFLINTKRASKNQLEDRGTVGESRAARPYKKVFHAYENDSQSRVMHTYENESQPPVLHTHENNPQAGGRMATTQDQSFASASSSSTMSENTYQELDVTKVDVYNQIIHPRSQAERKMSQR